MRLRALLLLAVLAVLGVLPGCKADARIPGIGNDLGGAGTGGVCVDGDGDGYGVGCAQGSDCDDANAAVTNQCYACLHPAPGCPCTKEGARSSCGKITAHIGSQTTCGYGDSICADGKWSDCVLDGTTSKSFTSSKIPLGIAPPSACTEKCDPYCQQFPDTPDNSLSQGALVGTDAGLTVSYVDGGVRPVMPNGPMPPVVKDQLTEAGLYPDAGADALIYHELPPPTTAQDTVTAIAATQSVDVYFLHDTNGNCLDENEQISDYVAQTDGLYDRVRRAIPDAQFGAGRYEQYDQAPWNDSGVATRAYDHVLSMTGSKTQISSALAWIRTSSFGSVPTPRSWVEALFAEATTGGLKRGAKPPWVAARSGFRSLFNAEMGACPADGVGYPCFRPFALPITVLVADAPANNGPGGEFAYARDSGHIVDGSTSWTGVPVTRVTGNGTEPTAYPIDPTRFAIYSGNTNTDGQKNETWHWDTPTGDTGNPPDQRGTGCTNGWFAASPNVFFTFTVTERTWFHFDTVGSTFTPLDPDYGTSLYLYRQNGAATTGIACNYSAFFHRDAVPNVSSIEGYVDPGVYYLVIDGIYGAKGEYLLHVNAMPDGTAAAAPNFAEAVAAYNAIGGRVVGVDTSGYGCSGGYAEFVQTATNGALEKLARDTASVDPTTGDPYVLHLTDGAQRCTGADPPALDQMASAILGVANSRMDVNLAAVDNDDARDFDGPGGASTLTVPNIDDATFVQSVAAISTPESMTNCQQTLADHFVGCRPGTRVSFSVTFRTPGTVTPSSRDQIFGFVLRAMRDNAIILNETPVVIVVPATGFSYYSDAWFVRDYDTTNACPKGTAPLWSLFTWTASTPGDSKIDLEVAVAPSIAELSTAPFDPLTFSSMPGPAAVVGQPIGVQRRAPTGPNTESGGTLVDSTLVDNMRARDSKMMRLRAHLVPSQDRTLPPVLRFWNQRISCQPAE